MRGLQRASSPALLALVLGLAGCGGSQTHHPQAITAAPADIVRSANCLLWSVEDQADRARLLLGLRDFFSQRLDNGSHFRLIPDQRAARIISHYCSLPFAKAFLIYRLYGNATAFGASG